MNREAMEVRAKEGSNPEWVRMDVSKLLDYSGMEALISNMLQVHELFYMPDASRAPAEQQNFPDFGANRLRKIALKHVCDEIAYYTRRAVSTVVDMPSTVIIERRAGLWKRMLSACEAHSYSDGNIRRAIQAQTSEQDRGEKEVNEMETIELKSTDKLSGNEILIEIGVKSALGMMFALLRQAWEQLAWQKQLEQTLITSTLSISTQFRAPTISLPNEVLRSTLGILRAIPPLSFSNERSISSLGVSCLKQTTEFLFWITSPESLVDQEGKQLAAETTLSIALQYGTLSSILQWVDKMFTCLSAYRQLEREGKGRGESGAPNLSREFCEHVLEEVRARTQVTFLVPSREGAQFQPKNLTPDGHVSLLEFCLFLCQELSDLCVHCTQYFSQGVVGVQEERYLSEASEAYAFGSNSSSQLAMGTQEKILDATHMPHMANSQLVVAGQYCSFVVYGDGTVKACGKGSYGRLGLSNSDNQPTLKKITDFPRGSKIRRMATSRGSDGHSIAVDTHGNCYSWGDGNYGKLGHGDNMTQKCPRQIQGLIGKPARWVSCGNRHSAVATMDGELFTWGEGDYGRLGHGTTGTLKVPTKVQNIESVRQVDCGAAHTMCLSMDSVRVWSFGAGDSGKLGHGDTNRQLLPKVVETLRGVLCQKVCASSQFSLILSAAGKVYACGNGSGVGKGTTEPRQYTPAIIEHLEQEIIIDIVTGDGHCLALTQRGAVYAWGTNSMGQCGQGHSTGSITLPAKVHGLQGKQIQQISAGTSHSVVWTAVPLDRRASTMWHWPYCVCVGEKTFKHLLTLLTKYGDVSEEQLPLPFTEKSVQEVFSLAILSLTRTHLSLVVPLGAQCVHMACGAQVRPLRNFLFKLMDSHLSPSLDLEASKALEIGQSVLLPPVLDRMELLLAVLPEEPSQITSLTAGQCRQLEILLAGFSNRNEMVGILANEDMLFRRKDRRSWTTDTPHLPRLYTLIYRMTEYLKHAIIISLNGETPCHEYLKLGSSLITSFEQFLLCFFIHVMSLVSTTIEWSTVMETQQEEVDSLVPHMAVFTSLLDDHILPVVARLASSAREASDPMEYLKKHEDILTGFLLNQFLTHMALVCSQVFMIEYVCNISSLLLKTARIVHEVIAILPQETIDTYEREELDWEPRNYKPEEIPISKLRSEEGEVWRKVMDLERVLCFSAAKINKTIYMGNVMTHGRHSEYDCLHYNVFKGKTKLLECGLLSNGGVGGNTEVTEAMNQWAALCKALPGTTDGTSPWTKCKDDFEAIKVKPTSMPYVQLDNPVSWEDVVAMDVETAPPLFALALGCGNRIELEIVYQNMMDYARHKDWNTSFDEATIPQLRQVSCAALACLLKHTGLFTYACSTSRAEAKKSLHDVYRCVFMLRRDVFTNRPLPPTSSGQVDEGELKKFTDICTGICATLFFFTVILNPAIPEESDRIVPQIPSSKAPPMASNNSEAVGVRSPGAQTRKPHFEVMRPPSDSALPNQMQESPMGIMRPTSAATTPTASDRPESESEPQVWNLSAVKVALSHLHWQREKVLRSDTPLHLKLGSTLMEVVGSSFHLQEEQLFNRFRMIKSLLSQAKRGAHRVDGLERVAKFLEQDPSLLLPSSRLIYLYECIPHHVHYYRDITASPSILQHKVKTITHHLLQKILEETFHTEPDDLRNTGSVIGMQRRLLVAIQWINFPADTDDLILLFSLDIYRKLVAISGLVSTKITDDVVLPEDQLTLRTYLCGMMQMENLALRTGRHADVLKSHPHILSTISDHLYGIMEGFVKTSDPVVVERWKARGVSVDQQEIKLGRLLCFLNTLSATHTTIKAVLAEDRWFSSLIQIVNIDTDTGFPHVSSLKTRLLALQVLGTIMNELTDTSSHTTEKCVKTIDALMDLMQRCMFLAPLTNFQHSLKSDESSSTPVKQVTLPFRADIRHQNNCTVVVEGQGVVAQGSGANSYVQGLLSLNSGKHTWKVSVESETAVFCVGVAHKPLITEKDGSLALWALEAHTGRLLHSGDTTEALFIITEKESITVEFDARGRTLAFSKNDEPFRKAFDNVGREDEDLFPIVMFDKRTSCRVMIHPITHSSHSLLAHVKRREQEASGYPLMSPMGVTLVHAIVSIVYQIQDKQPWIKAISQVLLSRLSEMDVFIHRLVDIRSALESSSTDKMSGTDRLLPQLASVLTQLQQVVWPALIILGGLDSGYCLGRDCQKYEEKETKVGTIVSVPDGDKKVLVQEQITTATTQIIHRSTHLKDLKLPVQSRFSISLIFDQLSPSVVMNITRLAGYLDDKLNDVSSIMDRIHSRMHYRPTAPHHSQPYQQLCENQIQVAAAKSLQGILFNESMIKLLDYQSPSKEVVDSGAGVDRIGLAVAVREVLKCLISRAIKPSPMKVALRPMEMERVYSIVSYECLGAVSEYMSSSGHRRPQLTSQQIEATIPSPAPEHQVTRPDTLPPETLHFNYFEEDFLDAYFARNATPTYIHNMMDMGFGRAQINLALDRVEFPTHITDYGRMNMLVSWIVDHPLAAQEEEARARREQEEQSREEERQKKLEEQRKKMEAEQRVAATHFLSLFGEMLDEEGEDKDEMDVGVRREEVKRDTSHAPDLLEGPSINQNIPGAGMQSLDASQEALHSLLSALGLAVSNPSPRLHKFSEADAMGEVWCRRDREYGELFGTRSDGTVAGAGEEELVDEHILKIGSQCEEMVSQSIKLQDMDECLLALQRLTGSVQTLVARRITMLVIASLSTDTSLDFFDHLRSLGLVDVLSLVRLLRLVHAGRIDGTPSKLFGVRTPSSLLPIRGLDCLSSALTTVVTDSLEAGSQLMQACSRDLLAAAVGGAKLLEKPRRRRRRNRNRGGNNDDDEYIDPNEKSDLAVLSNPNFSVTQSLVETMAEAAGKAVFVDDTGVLLMTDALAACLFSSKLESNYRFWSLEQLLKVFATSSRRETTSKLQPEDLVLPSQVLQLVGHTGQAMACCDSSKSNKILSIGEDNALLVWSEESGLDQPQVYPFPKPIQQESGYLLPVLAQSSNEMCAAGALNDTLCIWRVKDGVTVSETFPELITALQWKPGQRDSETPLMVVGLVGGDLVMVEVMGARVNMSPSLQLTRLEHFGRDAISILAWSSKGTRFACCSPAGTIQVYSGSNREYVPSIRIRELTATSLSWSPDEKLLTTLEPEGAVKLWDVSSELARLVYSLGPYTVTDWQGQAGNTGTMLLAGGCPDNSIDLWLVDYVLGSESEVPGVSVVEERWGVKVAAVATLSGHQSPLTALQFTSHSSSLLASGGRDGSVRIWDVQLCRLMKCVLSQSVGEVLDLTWTRSGLAICYKDTNTVYLIPPGVSEYAGERCLLNCYPVLYSHGISDLTKAPCLSALLKNLHHILLDQYSYEEREVRSSQQIVFSEYLQMLTALAVGLGLHTVLTSPPHPPHFTSPPPAKEWEWLKKFSQAIKMSESLMKRTPLPDDIQVLESNLTGPLSKEEEAFCRDNSIWTLTMDTQILEWVTQQAQDWWTSRRSHVYVWGKGHWNVIGHSGRERILPSLLDEWKDIRMITAGSYCTYAVRFDGSVASVGEGSYGRLGHSQSDNARLLRNIESLQGIHVVEVVAGIRVTTATEEGFALALTNTGDVYSWGKSYRGRLGHPTADNQRTPKLIEALAGKECKQIATCDYHSAMLTFDGHLYTCGAKENGKLGHGSQGSSGNIGRITQITKFLDSDEQTDMDIRIGYIALGQSFTIAISEDMRKVFGCGKADHGVFGQRNISGDHHILFYLPHLTPYGPFKKAAAGYRVTILLNTRGQVIVMGKFFDSTGISEPQIVQFPGNESVVDVQTGSSYILALTETGSVYTWGKNSTTSYELGYEMASNQTTPKRVDTLYGRKIRQITAGVRHCLALDTPPPVRGDVMFAVPDSVPARYPALREIPCKAIHSRLMLLNHFAKLMVASWKLFSIQNIRGESSRFNINPLLDANIRALVSQTYVEGMMAGILSRTMNSKTHGPNVTVQRITVEEGVTKAIFPQIATQILQKPVVDLRCSSRAWKVNLVGEGADDAGGVFDETMAQMCEEMEQGVVKMVIPTPNGTNKIGFNTDRYVFDPTCNSPKDIRHLKFLGLIFGVAIRTRKPLNLHLARPMWKLLTGMTITPDDLEEVDLMFIQTLYGIRDVHKSGIGEEDFAEMIPIESFEAQSMNGKFVPIIPGGSNTKLTFHNRKEYVDKALKFRLHELDQQVAAVREGMSTMIPVPLLSLMTAKNLEQYVCGSEEIDIMMLKKVVRYRDGVDEKDQLIQWLWETLTSFTNEEKTQFLRFVSGRSRLPARVSEIPQRFQIIKWGRAVDALPTSQTCFFQIRLPEYTSQEILAEKLRYAIKHCRSIDMDNYMLRRVGTHEEFEEWEETDDEW